MTNGAVLVTSAGSKVLLVQAFKTAAEARSMRVLTADAGTDCASRYFSDGHFRLRRTDDPAVMSQLLDICTAEKVGLIVPTRDGELPFFASNRAAFTAGGIQVLVPEEDRLAICQDKRKFGQFLMANGFSPLPVVEPGHADEQNFPLFARPVTGAGGRGTARINDAQQLAAAVGNPDMLIHPFIQAVEYSVDLLMGLEPGDALQAVCRDRQSIVGGEAKISTVADRPDLCDLAMRVGHALGLVGHNVMQMFDDPQRGPLIIEVNPRFGGASNLSIEAGLASPSRLLGLLAGEIAARLPRPVRTGLTMLRYSQDVLVEAGTGA